MELELKDCVNSTCPWSGKPVSSDSLTLYKGRVVGFCNSGCRDKFDCAVSHFEKAIVIQTDKVILCSFYLHIESSKLHRSAYQFIEWLHFV